MGDKQGQNFIQEPKCVKSHYKRIRKSSQAHAKRAKDDQGTSGTTSTTSNSSGNSPRGNEMAHTPQIRKSIKEVAQEHDPENCSTCLEVKWGRNAKNHSNYHECKYLQNKLEMLCNLKCEYCSVFNLCEECSTHMKCKYCCVCVKCVDDRRWILFYKEKDVNVPSVKYPLDEQWIANVNDDARIAHAIQVDIISHRVIKERMRDKNNALYNYYVELDKSSYSNEEFEINTGIKRLDITQSRLCPEKERSVKLSLLAKRYFKWYEKWVVAKSIPLIKKCLIRMIVIRQLTYEL